MPVRLSLVKKKVRSVCKEHQAQLSSDLRLRQLKATPGRLLLLDILKHAAGPLSAKQLASLARPNGLNQSTVYRNLKFLISAHFVKPLGLPGRQSYYELVDSFSERGHHHYLICRLCNRVVEVPSCRVIAWQPKELVKLGFSEISDHSLELFGLCHSCTQKKNKKISD